jgi:hypothetical protein
MQTGRALRLVGALEILRDTLAGVRFPLRLPDAEAAAALASATLGQLDDYLLPRLGRLDAPLLVVVGGSTGAGKSTLVNSIVGAPVSRAGVLRPTTRAPVLVCHPDDAEWFTRANLLPRLGRTREEADTTAHLQVVPLAGLTPGLALLDAPDIDSVVEANRALAERLLAAADLWLFVTTAARYADAVPWELLGQARARGTAIALVLDRVPAGAEAVGPHLAEMLAAHELGDAPQFVIPESTVDGDGLLPAPVTAPVRDWLGALARSAADRAAVVRRTVDGAVAALDPTLARLAAAADEQVATADALSAAVVAAYRSAEDAVDRGVRDGAILRGEVLARWQELVGTGELMRGLQARVAEWRDKLVGTVTGRPPNQDRLRAALGSGLVTLVRGAAADAAEQSTVAWQAHPAGAALLPEGPRPTGGDDALTDRLERMTRDWQRSVLELVRTEVGHKRVIAKAGAYAVNGLGLVVMIGVFTATAFIPTGAEIAVAGGTTLAAQKVLEAIFGDQAVRELADRARVDLMARVRGVLDEEVARRTGVLAAAGVDRAAGERLRRAADAVRVARADNPDPTRADVTRADVTRADVTRADVTRADVTRSDPGR